MKGGDMIPPSMFGGHTSTKEWQDWVRLMVNSNFNMVRIWGGGDYATEDFLNECDRLGLMVWHDAMFACAMYPGDSMFLTNVEEELEYQLPRITAHPSVVYINGNNEVDVAWKNWGFQVQYFLNKEDQAVIEKAYDDLFKNVLPNTLAKYSNLPYEHTSPLSNWGKHEFYNHGTQHYWGVWHGSDPMSDFATKIGRFNAEFGFQSFPEFSTLEGFSTVKDWDLNSAVMKHHQKSYVGNGMIMKHAKRLFGKPSNFEEFVYFSQLTQAYAVTSAISGHLLDAPRCMGTLYWQINDCWPGPTWSSIDYEGQYKALHYGVKELYEELTAAKQVVNNKERIYLLTNNTEAKEVNITTSVFSIEKKGVKELNIDNQFISLANFNHKVLYEQGVEDAPRIVKVDLPNEGHRIFITGRLKSDRTVSYNMEIVQVDTLGRNALLVIENEDFMADVWMFSSVPGVRFDSNFCHLLPGKHEIPFTFESNMGIIKLMYR
jgi:beta-mannosidase